jgi:hypothetical protein
VQRLRAELPDVPIYYVSITPTPARWRYWTIVQEANRLIQAHTRTDPRLHFIDLTPALLGPDGRPDRKLYRADRVHPNRKGYAVWKAALKPVLLADFPTEEKDNPGLLNPGEVYVYNSPGKKHKYPTPNGSQIRPCSTCPISASPSSTWRPPASRPGSATASARSA